MEVDKVEIEKIAEKMAKLEAKLAGIQKAGSQAKLWTAIGMHAFGQPMQMGNTD
jgi:hypothetical protein